MRQCIVSIRCLQNTPYSWHPPFFEPRSSSFRFRSQSWTLPRCLDGPYRTSSQIITVRWMVLSNSYDYDFQLFTISCEQLWYLLRWSLLRWSSGCLERHLLLVSRCSEFFMDFSLAEWVVWIFSTVKFTNLPSGINCCTCGTVFCDSSAFIGPWVCRLAYLNFISLLNPFTEASELACCHSLWPFALLTGNPIAGALLTPHHLWHRPLIFAAVSCSMQTRRPSSQNFRH